MKNIRKHDEMKHRYSIFCIILILILSTVLFSGCSIAGDKNLKIVPGAETEQKNVEATEKTPDEKAPDEKAPQQNSGGINNAGNNQNPGSSPNGGTTNTDSQSKVMVTDTNSIMVLVNKQRNLPKNYEPSDLAVPDVTFTFKEDSPRRYMRVEAARALEKLFKKAADDNISIAATSGYRPYSMQKSIFERNAKLYGEKVANMTSAYPGQSEHQTGLAMDITSASVKFDLVESFGDTKEGKWLKENAAEFGFIIRYQKGKENITGYNYEPWHVRYVGVEAAKEIMEKDITLEEYLGFKAI